jgi:hypothetical protein
MVVFHDASGRVRSTSETGADGKACGSVTSGDMVTVAYGGPSFELVTVTDVRPGEEVVVGEREGDSPTPVVGIVAPRLAGPHDGATDYALSIGVGQTTVRRVAERPTLQVLSDYVHEGTFALLAEALDASGKPLAYAVARAATPKALVPVPLVLPAWSRDWQHVEVALTGTPTWATELAVELELPGDPGQLLKRAAHVHVAGPGESVVRFDVPKGIGRSAVVTVTASPPESRDGEHVQSLWQQRFDGVPPRVAIDLARLLPPVTAARVESTVDPARPRVSWSASDNIRDTDLSAVVVRWPEASAHRWTLVGPPQGNGPWQLPELPDALAQWRPDGSPMTAAVGWIDASEVDGYTDVLRRGLQWASDRPSRPNTLRMSMSGELSL